MKGRFFGKRLIALAMCLSMGLPMLPTGTAALAADIPYINENHWARDDLVKMAELNILQGDPDGNMYPDRAVTRAEFIAMINRAFNYTQFTTYELPFEDMTGEEWYANNVRVAYDQGYFSGQSENIAGAERQMTREEAAALICRNLKVENSQSLQVDEFSDGKNISQWSRDAISAAVGKGYIYGYNDGTFKPRNYITRAEAATMLSNSLGTILQQEGSYSYGTVNGNVTISRSGIELNDTVITGDLYITEGVGTGYINLNNVTVMGEVIVCGGGEGNWGGNSVNFTDCTINKLTADGPDNRPVALYAIGRTTVGVTNVKSDTYIENNTDTYSGFGNIDLQGPEDTSLNLAGTFDQVKITKPRNILRLGRGRIKNLVVDEDASGSEVTLDRETVVDNLKLDAPSDILGRGDVGSLVVAANGTSIEMLPDRIEIRPGYTASVAGQEMTSLDANESSDTPRILAGYPSIDEVQPTVAKMFFQTNKPGTIRWVITYVDVTDIDAEDIMKPHLRNSIKRSGTLNADESNKQLNLDISGLETNVEYRISAMLVDARDQQSPIKTLEFRTSDSTKPGFVSGYPKAVPKTSSSIDIDIITTKDCTVFWAVFPQGTIAPTVYEMRNQDYDGDVTHGKRTNCDKNIEYLLTADGLEERVTYDIYVMASDGENDSNIVKLTAATKDTTPPQFIRNTPMQDKITDTSVDVRVASNENATAYWVLMEKNKDSVFPAPIPPAVEPPSLDSDEAKQQIVTGNNVFKSGRGTARENVDSTVRVSGLKAQTTYDLYMLLMDPSGNMSEVKHIEIRTRDVIPPTATMNFIDDIEGKPQVEKPIQIVFSEAVLSTLTRQPLKSGDEGMIDNFTLYDRTNGRRDETVPIDFTKVTILEGDAGETIVNFPPEAFNYGEGLNSGSKYQFELNSIVDTSNNAMKNATLLEEFQTVPPLVQLTRTDAPENMDITFTIEPQSNKTADTILYDMIFESDKSISFMLFKKENGVFRDINFTIENSIRYYEPMIWLDNGKSRGGISLHYIIDRMIEGNADYHFEKFNELLPGEYGIRITAIGSDRDRYGWSETVNMEIKCVAGAKTVLDALAGNPVDGFTTAINNGAAQVNYPTKFEVSASFTDVMVPQFTPPYPILRAPASGVPTEDTEVADTLIRPQIMTNRKATMYYFIVPAGKLDIDADKDGQYSQEELNALALPILDNALRPEGSVWGMYAVESGNAVYQPTIEGLNPNTAYDVFLVLKGTPPEPSDVWYQRITTTVIAPPVLTITIPNRTENAASIHISSDKNAVIDWIVLPKENADQYISNGQVRPDSVEALTNIIRNTLELPGGTRPTANGKVTTTFNRQREEYYSDLNVSPIKRDVYYRLFAVSKAALANGQTVGGDSIIAVSEEFTARDVTPPVIIGDGNRLPTIIGTISGSDSSKGNPYNGDVTILFSEGLFYIEYESAKAVPIDNAVTFASNLVGNVPFTVVSGTEAYASVIVEEGGGTVRALRAVTLRFTGAQDGSTVLSNLNLCDANGNVAGYFRMTFHDTESSEPGSRKNSYWSYEFITTT